MKYFKIILIIIFISFLYVFKVNAYEFCEMSSEYEKWLELSDDEKKNAIVPLYCKDSYQNNYGASQLLEEEDYIDIKDTSKILSQALYTQKKYSSYDYNYVNQPMDQYRTNSCWAFSSLSAVETSAIMDGLTAKSLSPKHMEYMVTRYPYKSSSDYNVNGFNRELDSGGNAYFAASYLFRHDGPILETDMPYTTYNNLIDKSSMPNSESYYDVGTYKITEASVPTSCSALQIEKIKKYLVQYGSVVVSIYYNDLFLANNKYYNYVSTSPANGNHAVTIVGWDDTISASNFKNSVNDGAWLVKNSWGTDWGESGNFWVSYDDIRICGDLAVFYDIRKNTYNNVYFSADTLSNVGLSVDGTVYLKTKFTKKSEKDEYLDKVSFELVYGTNYVVYVSTSTGESSDWKKVAEGYSAENGVVSARFNPIKITSDYYVIIKLTTNTLPLMCKRTVTDIHDSITISKSTNYVAINSTTSWTDISILKDSDSSIDGCEPVVYAYTTDAPEGTANFRINSIRGTTTKVYKYTDDYFYMSITTANITSYNKFSFKVVNNNDEDFTSYFFINNTVANGVVKIIPTDDCPVGTYKIRVSYDDKTLEESFTYYELKTSNSNYSISNSSIKVSLKNKDNLEKATFLSNIDMGDATYQILNDKNEDITSSTSYVGTGMKLSVGGKKFTVIVLGDVSGDGKILSNDALLIKRHLVWLTNLNDLQVEAADVSGDNIMMSNDALLISRFLVGVKDSL